MSDTNSLKALLTHTSLDTLLQETLSRVKSQADNVIKRELLFKLYCISGLWEKALLQLETIPLLDNEYQKQCELYKNLVFSELMREKVLAGEREAGVTEISPDADAWMAMLHQANQLFTQGKTEEADRVRNDAFDLAPAKGGTGEQIGDFQWIADGDGRLGPVCEFIHAGGYRWIAFSDIESIILTEPKGILDVVWKSAEVKVNGKTWFGYMPARYPVSNSCEQSLQLGFETHWRQVSDSFFIGSGQKMFITDAGEFSLLKTGSLKLR
ncbi:type VI secretion system accessory protein TagJ [Atlantibacter sp.]|uniref:type VI secretion system accessory protein TagJ n=1 Tax=Atlantibacter sp. TaxID=1903473 RepID=UPI0028B073E0|nr:type VI secretion system accessory protein TagJ [Atlantibacter sp.]